MSPSEIAHERLVRLQLILAGVAGFFVLWGGGLPVVIVAVIFGLWAGLTSLKWLPSIVHGVATLAALAMLAYGVWLINVGAAQQPDVESAIRFRGGLLALSGLFGLIGAGYGLWSLWKHRE